ncbi:hypothetical protein LFL96_33290 [Paraburkholderia sp. D15]|uniref:hypothetical protein n=1 Tax=Paraburkholderia sp. D15 TaxID=2880218 RepID=UPI0024793688|nr:hypothetical protein [Paraburkholderia sp. D15]WGS53048.1 hypothetical protein LFL96_33290 [Paraburkholderia sp. D15]
MSAETKFHFFPGKNTPSVVRVAVAIYWLALANFLVHLVSDVGIPPFHTRPEIEGAITALVLLCMFLIPYAFTIVRLSSGKLWARNVVLLLTALVVVITVRRLLAYGISFQQRDIMTLISVAAEAVAALFLLVPRSTFWFRSKVG